MSKYIKLEDAIYKDCILIDEIECDDCPFYDEEHALCRMVKWLSDLPTIEVSEDCISREWVLEVIDDCINYPTNGDKACAIKNAPSVVPSCQKNRQVERAEGEWVVKANGNNECSVCGREKQNGWVNFCGFCGAKMKGTEE